MNFKTLKARWTQKDTNPKPSKKQASKRLPWNIYDSKTWGQHYSKFHRYHFWFKNKFITLLLWLALKTIGQKNLDTKINTKNQPWNTNLAILDQTWEQSIIDWNILYRRNGGLDTARKTKAYWKKQARTNEPCIILRNIKNIAITGINIDTAYREFYNIWAHNFTKTMMKEYTNKKKYPNGVGHLFYAEGGMYDVDYKLLFKQIQTKTIREVTAQLRNANDTNKSIPSQTPPQTQNKQMPNMPNTPL
jgi:hypothetical protein